MVSDYELDPFQHQVAARGLQSSNSISPDDIRSIVSSVDCIKYHNEFVNFVKRYWSDVLMDQEAILSVIRILIAIEDICKSDLSSLVENLAKQYEDIITENPIRVLDVDITLNLIRCFMDYDRSIKLCLLALSTKIKSLKSGDESSDTYNIINNHRDVLEKVYNSDLLVEYGYVLDDAISQTFRQ